MQMINSNIRRQAPLTKYAIAFAFGISLSRFCDVNFNVLLALLVLSTALICHFLLTKRQIHLPMIASIFLLGSIISIPQKNPYPEFTSQESEVEIFVNRINRNAKGASYGIGEVLYASKNFQDAKGREIWFYVKDNQNILRGDKVKGTFIIRKVEKSEGFNDYLLNKNIFFNAYTSEEVKVEKAKIPYSIYNSVNKFIQKKLETFYNKKSANSDGATAYQAMILGDKSYLSNDAKTNFKQTGTMHIFAVSGLHVGMLASILYFILTFIRLPRKFIPFVSLPILFLYVNVCQAPTSAMRAFIMISAVWISFAFLRKPNTFASLVAAFFISLILKPSNLFDAGFALSYSVVLAIVLYAVELNEVLLEKIQNWRGFELKNPPFFRRIYLKSERYVIIGLCIGFSAMFASAPLCSYYFGYVALLSALLSVPFVLGATIAVACGVASVILPNFLCPITNSIAAFILEIMLRVAKIFSEFGMVLDIKITPIATFVGIWSILISLIFYQKIKSPYKWFLPPSLTILTLLSAIIF